MKERPILFSDPMIRAILDGRKSQTRRVVKPQPFNWADLEKPGGLVYAIGKCSYGQPGDRLWVRETWLPWDASSGVEKYLYRATEQGTAYDGSWKPSLFMPRAASRITLEITKVRVERLKDINEGDAGAEGAPIPSAKWEASARDCFKSLWDQINSKYDFGWDRNPWVFVIEFNRVQ